MNRFGKGTCVTDAFWNGWDAWVWFGDGGVMENGVVDIQGLVETSCLVSILQSISPDFTFDA